MPKKYKKFSDLQSAWNGSEYIEDVRLKLGFKTVNAVRAYAKRAQNAGFLLKDLEDGFFPKERFMVLWNTKMTISEIAEFLGYSEFTCKIYASNFRKEGHELRDKTTKVPDQMFIDICNQSSNLLEVEYKTGYNRNYIKKRMSNIRKTNTNLKSFIDELACFRKVNSLTLKDKEFKEAWNSSFSLKEIASKTGYSIKSLSSLATRKRKAGIDLKYLPCKNSLQLSFDF